jgi:splicing factor 3A subunit 1
MEEDMEEESEDEKEEAKTAKKEDVDVKLPSKPVPVPSAPKAMDTSKPIKIRKDYVFKGTYFCIIMQETKWVLHIVKSNTAEPTQICPRCNQAIKVSEMEEHTRIELLDPKWREQKLAAEAKKRESNIFQGCM